MQKYLTPYRAFKGLARPGRKLSLGRAPLVFCFAYRLEAVPPLLAMLATRDMDTFRHSARVARYAVTLARACGADEEALWDIGLGSLLHDIGKMGIPNAVLRKQGKLSLEEQVVMAQHPVIGYRMIAPLPFLHRAAEIVYAHHERYDGGGYPLGLKGAAIPLGARIFAVAEAAEEICRLSGAQFDPQVVEAFLRLPPERVSFEPSTPRLRLTG